MNYKNKNTRDWDKRYSREDDPFSFDDVFKVAERELINPKLSRWDKEDLHDLIMRDLKKFVLAANMEPYATAAKQSDVAFENEIEKVFPKYLFYDTFNINYTPTDGIKMGNVDESNKWLFDFIVNKASDYYFKTCTQSSNFNSYVLTSEIAKQLLLLYQQQNPEGPKNDGEGKNGKGKSGIQKMLEGNGSGSGQQPSEKQLQDAMDKARENAEKEMEKGEDAGDTGGGLSAGKDLGQLSFGEINEFLNYQDAIRHIQLKSDLVSSFVKTTLNLSKTYFSSKYKEFEEELLEADEIDDIQGLENLMPQMKRIHLDDIITHARQYHMKFDVYVDISGSMEDKIYKGGRSYGSSSISGLDMAKITCLKLKQLGYVEDVYPFEGHVHPPMREALQIATMRTCGGTSIDRVIENVGKTGRPSVVITDMQDHISLYSDNVYFIGILGATFSQFRGEDAGKQYINNKQCVAYMNDNTFQLVAPK